MPQISEPTLNATHRSNPRSLLPNLIAGSISGIVNVIYSVSYAVLIFSGTLSSDLATGINCALISATLSALIFTLYSSLPFIIAGPDSNSSAILALISVSITTYLSPIPAFEQNLLPTVLFAVSLSTAITGLFLFGVGYLKLGSFIRFIPYPVVGGFLAGVGWLLVQGSFAVMLPQTFSLIQFDRLLQISQLLYWLPGLGLAISLYILNCHFKHFLMMPSLVLGTGICCHIIYQIMGLSLLEAQDKELIFADLARQNFWQIWDLNMVQQINWTALTTQGGSLITLSVVVAITILLSATGIELATQSDVDLDRELQVGGINNLITGLCGGMVGYLSISRTLLNYQAGARNRIAGFIAVGVCCFFLIFGVSFLSYIPKATFGGLLLYLGISLLIEWVYEAWFKLSRLDYILVFAILVIVANFGFLSGVGMGVVIACLLFVFNYSNLRVIKSSLSGHSYQSNFERSFHQKRLLQSKGYELYILLLQGYIFFGTANNLLSHVRNLLINQTPEKIKFMLLDFRLVVGIDSSALVSFIKMRQLAQKLQVKLILTGLTSPIEAKLVQQGVLDLTEEDGPCRAFADLDRGVEWCENQMLSTGTFRRKRFMPFAIQLEEFFPAPDKIRKFLGYMERVRADRDYVVFKQGERSDSIYFVESGQVSIVRESENGQMERMGTVGEGTVLGEIGFYTKSPRSSTVIADKSSRLYRLDQSTLEKIQTEEPLLAAACHQFIAQLLAERVMQATRKTQMLLQ